MRKNSIFFAAGLVTLLAIHATSMAQTNTKIANEGIRKSLPDYDGKEATEFTYVVAGNAGYVHAKAARNFKKYFKTATNVTWFDATGGYRANFESAGIRTWVDYDKKGNWLHTIRIYNERELPKEVRHLVKSNYYDHVIKLVHEIELPGGTICYIVHLENEKTLIDLLLHDGEMDVLKEFVKR